MARLNKESQMEEEKQEAEPKRKPFRLLYSEEEEQG